VTKEPDWAARRDLRGERRAGDRRRIDSSLALVPPPPPPGEKKPIPVGGAIQRPAKVHHVAPVYPAIALQARVEGLVIISATIGVDGSVTDATVLSAKPLLAEAAVEAVRQWRFTPTRLNGEPVPVMMTVTVAFRRQGP
jgi:periplasmic protein TonB